MSAVWEEPLDKVHYNIVVGGLQGSTAAPVNVVRAFRRFCRRPRTFNLVDSKQIDTKLGSVDQAAKCAECG